MMTLSGNLRVIDSPYTSSMLNSFAIPFGSFQVNPWSRLAKVRCITFSPRVYSEAHPAARPERQRLKVLPFDVHLAPDEPLQH
jgi:hypothetical protein